MARLLLGLVAHLVEPPLRLVAQPLHEHARLLKPAQEATDLLTHGAAPPLARSLRHRPGGPGTPREHLSTRTATSRSQGPSTDPHGGGSTTSGGGGAPGATVAAAPPLVLVTTTCWLAAYGASASSCGEGESRAVRASSAACLCGWEGLCEGTGCTSSRCISSSSPKSATASETDAPTAMPSVRLTGSTIVARSEADEGDPPRTSFFCEGQTWVMFLSA